MQIRRKDRKGRVLHEGEYERFDKQKSFKNYARRLVSPDGSVRWLYAKSLRKLRERAAHVERDMVLGTRLDASCVSLDDMHALWLRKRELDVRNKKIQDSTLLTYDGSYERYIQPALGATHIANIRRYTLECFYRTLIAERGLSLNSIRIVHRVMVQILKIAKDEGLIQELFTAGIVGQLETRTDRIKAKERREARALTRSEQELFLDFVHESNCFSHWFPFFYFMFYTGMRCGEGTALCDHDIRDDIQVFDVVKTLVYVYGRQVEGKRPDGTTAQEFVPAHYSLHLPKTIESIRKVPFLKEAVEAIRMEKERQRQCGITCSVSIAGNTEEIGTCSDFVFLNGKGGVHNRNCIDEAIKRIVDKCNKQQAQKASPLRLRYFSAHNMRHTFATRQRENGVPIDRIQAILGHSDYEFTDEVYVHLGLAATQNSLAQIYGPLDDVGVFGRRHDDRFGDGILQGVDTPRTNEIQKPTGKKRWAA